MARAISFIFVFLVLAIPLIAQSETFPQESTLSEIHSNDDVMQLNNDTESVNANDIEEFEDSEQIDYELMFERLILVAKYFVWFSLSVLVIYPNFNLKRNIIYPLHNTSWGVR